jgi:SpoVK/Ycf46/Vps4 family AAA+-type ATPase
MFQIMSISECNNTDWNDVAGLESAKRALREIVVLPFQRP